MDSTAPTATYVIRVQGLLDARWASWFDGLAVSTTRLVTRISGPIRDLSQLHGLLTRVHDLGLTLLEVRRLPEGRPLDGR